jgi:hypothetical protein
MFADYESRWKIHCRRWNLETPQFDFSGLRYRTVTSLDGVFAGFNEELVEQLCRRFCMTCGVYAGSKPRKELESVLFREDQWKEWISYLQCLLWSLADFADMPLRLSDLARIVVEQSDASLLVEHTMAAVEEALAMSPGAPVVMRRRGRSAILYPRGAKLLDDALVNDNLNWLTGHPKALVSFEKALALYLKGNTSTFRNLLDELRKALEDILRSILGNRKSLENQRDLLGKWIEGKGVHAQVRNMYMTLLKQFTDYQNDAVKHGDDWVESEVEYMIYLTGTFMRLLLVLNDDSQ